MHVLRSGEGIQEGTRMPEKQKSITSTSSVPSHTAQVKWEWGQAWLDVTSSAILGATGDVSSDTLEGFGEGRNHVWKFQARQGWVGA